MRLRSLSRVSSGDCFVAKAPRNDSLVAIIMKARDLVPCNDN